MNTNQTALSDITILDLCDEKGQLIGKLLGEMGARVIKIEPPQGDSARTVGPFRHDVPDKNSSLHFWVFNAAKEGITLDLTTAKGAELFRKLVEKADVALESYDPGYLDSLGLGYSDLSAINPALVMTSLTGFGQDGPYRDYKTSDLVAMAMGGIMHSCGYDDLLGSPPIRPSGGGERADQFIAPHAAAVDSRGDLYVGDVAYTIRGQHMDPPKHLRSFRKFARKR